MRLPSWPLFLFCTLPSARLIAAGPDTTIFEGRHETTMRRLEQPGGLGCYDSLIFSDVDFNRKVTKTEYITFLELFGPSNFLPDGIDEFDDLPLVLKSNFLILACLCQQQPDADPNCCIGDAAHLSNLGAAPDEDPTREQEEALSQICFLSEASVNRYVETIVPTPPPVTPPTPAPIVLPTRTPTLPPTPVPIPLPTKVPTRKPTIAPTAIKTPAPTPAPTSAPSSTPTIMDTPEVTTEPPQSSAPTTEITSLAPTGTEAPSAAPTAVTDAPTAIPDTASVAPTDQRPVDVIAKVAYIIAKKTDVPEEIYKQGLVAAMDILVPQVAAITDLVGRRLTSVLRILQETGVRVSLPTIIDGITPDTNCPSFVRDQHSCEDVFVSVGLFVDGADTAQVRKAFEAELETAIYDGELQAFLEVVDPDSPVYVVGVIDSTDGENDDGSNERENDDGLTGAAISGIVIGGMASIIIVIGLLARRRSKDEVNENYALSERLKLEEMEELNALETPQASNLPGTGGGFPGSTVGMVAASKDPRERQDSDAGSSGWSSREGMSSVDEDSKASMPSASGTAYTGDSEDDPNIHDANSSYSGDSSLQLTYTELDQAIQKGDWAAVGVTAALLASQSHGDAAEKKVNFQGDMNPDRAAELDRLVEAGDWAGVVAAAAKYDAQEAAQSTASDAGNSSASVASTRTGDSGYSGTGTAVTGASGAYASTATTNSDSGGSRARKVEEIRAEVEALVEKVVPEEKGNIDEMMMQFRGREEELVETLRTMQEREVAQKARLEGQKRAKRDARETAEQKKLASTSPAVEDQDDNWMEEIDKIPAEPDVHLIDTSDTDEIKNVTLEEPDQQEAEPPKQGRSLEDLAAVIAAESPAEAPTQAVPAESDHTSEVVAAVAVASVAASAAAHSQSKPRAQKPKKMEDLQEALKRAIDAEDWEKVAETAAGLSGKYIYDSDDEDVHTGSVTSTDKSQNASSTKSTEKSQKINELVDKGDWDAVVAAASQFAEDDYKSASTADDSKDIEERRLRRQLRLKEEQDALEQADIWSAIADQTRQSTLDRTASEANRAATVAADWAIARSLNELTAADKAGRLSEKGTDSDSSSDGESNQEV